jgi:hypothetical protein
MEPVKFSKEWFDVSSNAWRANKNKKPNGCYVYQCKYIHSKGQKCTKDVEKIEVFCKKHLKFGKKLLPSST